jgi:hypothetical protein
MEALCIIIAVLAIGMILAIKTGERAPTDKIGVVTWKDFLQQEVGQEFVTLLEITMGNGGIIRGAIPYRVGFLATGDSVEFVLSSEVVAKKNVTATKQNKDGSTEILSRAVAFHKITKFKVLPK